jgi:DAK2 domain fusion protein YloV
MRSKLDRVGLVWQALTVWLRRARTIIADSAPALNAMNVFPVSDSDTGTNVDLTLSGISEALPAQDKSTVNHSPPGAPKVGRQLDALASAAILSAHGNCGAIVAEMFTSVCRTFQHGYPQLRSMSRGSLIGVLLRTASTAANRAVARPVAGTILTVAEKAAEAAESAALSNVNDALAVARVAQSAARAALARTPEQLEVLARAGVVDAGGQAFVLLVDVLVEVLGGPRAEPLALPADRPLPSAPARGRPSAEYEVMYALTGATAPGLDDLRRSLSDLGNSVVIVGDRTVAQVHVHAADAGATIEAALDLGTLGRIRVTALDSPARANARVVVSAVAGEGIAEAVRSMGGVPVGGGRSEDVLEELTTVVEHAGGDVVLLPNGMVSLDTVTQLADHVDPGRRVAIIPTSAQVQGLAALAVHEPSVDFDSTVAAMSTAAGDARHAGVTIAERPAMTMAGYCRAGDALGLVEGDVVEIGNSVVETGWRVVERLLASGGELLTLITGAGADRAIAVELARRAHQARNGLEVEILDGGQRRYLLLVGLE